MAIKGSTVGRYSTTSQPHKHETPLPNMTAGAIHTRRQKLKALLQGRSRWHRFVKWRIVETHWFTMTIISAIVLNAIVLALDTDQKLHDKYGNVLKILDNIFLGIYILEFFLKFYAEPINYWFSLWNLFDFAIIVISLLAETINLTKSNSGFQVFRVFRIVRTIRILRAVRFIKGVEVLVVALAQTLRQWVVSVLLLIVLLIYFAAIIGHNVFSRDLDNWGTLRVCFISLASYVTTDGWYDRQSSLEKHGYVAGSRFFALVVIWTVNFMFTNLFVAVILNNIDDATSAYEEEEAERKAKILRHKKEIMMMHQREDLKLLMHCQQKGNYTNFQQMVADFQTSLKHDDIVVLTELSTNLIWMETYLLTMEKMDNYVHSVQQFHYELANTLCQAMQPGLLTKYGVESSNI